MIRKIISGGQTGVDRAALDVAIKLAVAHGGWIPKGRITESGPLPDNYNLKETRSSSYSDRTEKNVLDSDGTLIISRGSLTGDPPRHRPGERTARGLSRADGCFSGRQCDQPVGSAK